MVATSGAANSATSWTTTCGAHSLDDLEQVVRTRLQLDPDEELGEDEWADAAKEEARQHVLERGGQAAPRSPVARPTRNAVKPSASASPATGSPDANATSCPASAEGTCEWQHRPIVTRQRSAGQERTHRARLS